ncbi:hypothetical protein SAY87_019833 [Trapa incisa]|uniref:H/ACA ribonucleoprotein complex non-core subunit NAF1 n=1 Tax=Trapa incisa TaxID=236973 RepID=A0AAN7K303_9MYRT|nr:hypothetical protein SAY87_019833 [Trapa incisa]
MVGFISEPVNQDDGDISPAPNSSNSNVSPAAVDQNSIDISLADAFLDFESIKLWFDHIPDDPGSSEQPGELLVDGAKEVEALTDEFFVKSELISDGEVGRASALGGVDDSHIDPFVGHLKIDSLGDGESRGNCLDCKKSESGVNDEKGGEMAGDDSERESSSESDSTDSSSSSSGSSDDDKGNPSSSDSEDDTSSSDDEHIKEINFIAGELEEGEIRETDSKQKSISRDEDNDNEIDDGETVDNMVGWSDAEDQDGTPGGGGPVRSYNEVKVLPPVPRVEAKLEWNHEMSPVGMVLSVLGAQVIVEGIERHTPLDEGSILWITEKRLPLGFIDEIFGPVKNPYYVVRYNYEVPCGICHGTLVSLVPEFASYILNEKNLYKKGYDASGENDEELSEEAEFSDDEKEAEYRRMQKMTKRGATDLSGMKDVKNFGKKCRDREGRWKNNRNSSSPSQQMWPNVNQQIQSSCNSPSSSGVHPNLMGGTGMISPFYPPPQSGGSVPVTSNGVWMNGNYPCQQQIRPSLANDFPNMLQWATQGNQFPYQIPMQNPFLHPNFILPNTGQSNALGGLPFAPFSGPQAHNAGNNQMFGMTSHEIPSFNAAAQSVQPNCLQVNPSLGNSEAPRMFNTGVSSDRGGRPPLNRRGGGRFAGNRGRNRFK